MGGTSIESIFRRSHHEKDGFTRPLLRHQTLTQCHRYCQENASKKPSIVFIVLRNRYDQLLSSWRWLCRDIKHDNGPKRYTMKEYSFTQYLKNIKLIHSKASLDECSFHQSGTYILNLDGYIVANYRPIAFIDYWTNSDPNVIELQLSSIGDDFNAKIAPLDYPFTNIPNLNQN